MQPPTIFRWWIRLAGRMVPPGKRSGWIARWDERLHGLWTLVERGELAFDWPAHLAGFSRDMMASAVGSRFDRDMVLRWLRAPGFVLIGGTMLLLLAAVLSHGFAVTRSLAGSARSWYRFPLTTGAYDPRLNRVVLYTFPILTALVAGATLAAGARLWIRHNPRYWWFLTAKLVLVMAVASLAWIEGGAALRSHLHGELTRVLAGGFVPGLVFLGISGGGVIWSLTDQRRRCPVCLRRLVLPVTLGSWASVFDPASTELLCGEGHGSLSLTEVETGPDDQWFAMDSSWRGFFLRR